MSNKIYDILVAGGGLSGLAAAVAAAREGSDVLLIERYGFLGGMATAGLVNPFMPYTIWKAKWQSDWDRKVNSGIFSEVLKNLDELEGLHSDRATFNEELLKLVLDRLVKKYRIGILLHSYISAVEREGNTVQSVTVTNKSGISQYRARYFVDATGDADLSFLAGCSYRVGRDGDSLCQPMTLCFRIGNIDSSMCDLNKCRHVINEKYREFKAKGLIKNPREDVLIFNHMIDDVLHFNTTRIINKSALNAHDLTQAEMEGREQVYEMFRFIKDNVQGFENSQLLMTAPQTGVRESRRITGEYTITRDDLMEAKKFYDSIARGTYPVDIHNPAGTGTVMMDIPYGDYYTIPYRALIPEGTDNLIVAGRPISSTHEAHSAIRVMPICTCIGEGAGTAAALALKKAVAFKQVDIDELHSLLDKYGALY